MAKQVDLTKRRFMQMGLAATAGVIVQPSLVLARPFGHKMKELAFYNLHTDEKLRVTYWKNGQFNSSAMSQINHILRDFRTGDVFPMSANLIDFLHDLQTRLRTDSPIEIISGYRSPRTNAALVHNSDGVARRSYHMKGLATDIRMRGVSIRQIQTAALFMKRGGVGFYPRSDFVHVDVGPVRRWG
ncbi:MAG: DUF882 domain-containing protein [Alphaproteobacteria bacterium]|nr:DUF882 domain-containing protein [Alphaproteobacteria bacterium]